MLPLFGGDQNKNHKTKKNWEEGLIYFKYLVIIAMYSAS